jgi:hypothetical protein
VDDDYNNRSNMTALVRCKGCGKIIPLSVEDAGQWVVCSACGESFKPPTIEQWGLSENWNDRLDPNANEYLAHAQDTSPIPTGALANEPLWHPQEHSLLPPDMLPDAVFMDPADVVSPGTPPPPAIAKLFRTQTPTSPAPEPVAPLPANPPALDQFERERTIFPARPLPRKESQYNWLVVGIAAVVVLAVGLMITGIVAVMRNAKRDRDRETAVAVMPPAPPQNKQQTRPSAESEQPRVAASTPAPAPSPSPTTAPATQAIATAVNRIIDRTNDIVEKTRRQPQAGTDVPGDVPPVVLIHARRPPTQRVPLRETGITDEQIGRSIQRAVDFLLTQFQGNRLRVTKDRDDNYYTGLNALCVYALLQAGQTIDDERLGDRGKLMKGMIDELKRMPMKGGHTTYARSIRANTLALLNRVEDRATLRDDFAWLVKNHADGAYTYGEPSEGPIHIYDNSNSQYGLLGVWAGAEAGLEVPNSYWAAVRKHWTTTQFESGEWGYNMGGRSGGGLSMTAAGLASLFVTHDQLEAPLHGATVGHQPFSKALARGLAWIETDDNALKTGDIWTGYILYGIERVGLASGFKYFGRHDWYRVLAARLVEKQRKDGSWGRTGDLRTLEQLLDPETPAVSNEELYETAFSLLFLARGRHPILMNKLRFDGFWANRPRDVANLARFASAEMERPLNWQVVLLDKTWTDWTDAPILYLASHLAPKLGEVDVLKLRRFIDAGGLLFTQSDVGSPQFEAFIVELADKLFPGSTLQDLPPDHEIYNLNYQIDPKPPLKYIGNGARVLMLHSPEDISKHWQLRADRVQRNVFQFGTNLFLYATGKRDLRNRLASTYLPEPEWNGQYTVGLARLMYAGAWDPEPMAFERFARYFEYQTGYEMRVTAIGVEELKVQSHPVAHMTGAAAMQLSEAQIDQLRRYVEDGGVLLIDACGGSSEFAAAALNAIGQAFPGKQLSPISPNHPLLAGGADGMDVLTKPELRSYTEQKLGRSAARLDTLSVGRGRVLFSNLDLTSGLLGTNTWGILGYHPDYAQKLLKNTLLWTLDGARTEPPKASAAADLR